MCMRVNSSEARKMDRAPPNSMTDHFIMVTLKRIQLMDLASMYGAMEEAMKVTSRIIKWKEAVNINGLKVRSMKVST